MDEDPIMLASPILSLEGEVTTIEDEKHNGVSEKDQQISFENEANIVRTNLICSYVFIAAIAPIALWTAERALHRYNSLKVEAVRSRTKKKSRKRPGRKAKDRGIL